MPWHSIMHWLSAWVFSLLREVIMSMMSRQRRFLRWRTRTPVSRCRR
jgi:hypothetical protein